MEKIDLTKELKEMNEECIAFCNFLMANKEEVGDWKLNKELYTKWNSFTELEKKTYI